MMDRISFEAADRYITSLEQKLSDRDIKYANLKAKCREIAKKLENEACEADIRNNCLTVVGEVIKTLKKVGEE